MEPSVDEEETARRHYQREADLVDLNADAYRRDRARYPERFRSILGKWVAYQGGRLVRIRTTYGRVVSGLRGARFCRQIQELDREDLPWLQCNLVGV